MATQDVLASVADKAMKNNDAMTGEGFAFFRWHALWDTERPHCGGFSCDSWGCWRICATAWRSLNPLPLSNGSAVEMLEEFRKVLSSFVYEDNGKCFYCGSPGQCQLDHFPVPVSAGGTTSVRACLNCHNIKDRATETFTHEYLGSHVHECSDLVLSEVEVMFICGGASLLPSAAMFLLDDIPDYPAALKIIIARRLRQQLQAMHSWSVP